MQEVGAKPATTELLFVKMLCSTTIDRASHIDALNTPPWSKGGSQIDKHKNSLRALVLLFLLEKIHILYKRIRASKSIIPHRHSNSRQWNPEQKRSHSHSVGAEAARPCSGSSPILPKCAANSGPDRYLVKLSPGFSLPKTLVRSTSLSRTFC